MDDKRITDMLLARDERAISEMQTKYGAYCARIANNILPPEDAEECLCDVWHTAWMRIPPVIPLSLKAFLGRLVRDISLSRYRANRAQKRFSGMEAMLGELSECVPDARDVQSGFEADGLSVYINEWLAALPKRDRILFVRRYYYGDKVNALAKEYGLTENQAAKRLQKMRAGLKTHLESKGVII